MTLVHDPDHEGNRMRVLAAALILVAVVIRIASATTYLVRPEGTGDYPTIQAAIDAAANGDTVALANGTFTGNGNRDIDFLGKAITARSGSGDPDSCAIDCGGSAADPHRGFRFHSGEGSASVLVGMTITRGYALRGGGILCETASGPSIVNCVLARNTAAGVSPDGGGGMGCYDSSAPSLESCTFVENSAIEHGGGIYCDGSSPTLDDCEFVGNMATGSYGHGGGVHLYRSSGQVTGCLFATNYAGGLGGGVLCAESSPVIADCHFLGNSGRSGGGLFCWDFSSPEVVGCDFSDNLARSGDGGGVCCSDSSAPTLAQCAFSGNSAGLWGGGIATWNSAPTISHCTIADNVASEDGGGAFFRSSIPMSPLLESCIIAFSRAGVGIACDGNSTPFLFCCDVYGNVDGDWVGCIADQLGQNGNISGDPLFCGEYSPAEPLAIHENSPCAPAQQPVCGLIGANEVGCFQRVYVVRPDGSGDFPTIQAAVEAADDWDMIQLAEGVFSGDGNRDIDFLGKAIVLQSQDIGSDGCIIDCQGSVSESHCGFLFRSGEGPRSVLRGITIRNGHSDRGGAISCTNHSSPLISGCCLYWNCGDVDGGAVYCEDSSPTLRDCTISHNYSPDGAGIGMRRSSPTVQNTVIAFGDSGGAVACHLSPYSEFSCCDLFGNEGGDWDWCISSQLDINGNFSADPCFCDADGGDYHLWNYSPCAQVGCGLIGAWPVGCTDPMAVGPQPLPWVLSLNVSPNPMAGLAQVRYGLPGDVAQPARLSIYDPAGRVVRTLTNDRRPSGAIAWDGTDALGHRVPAGPYFLRLRVGEEEVIRRVVVVK
jgi:predicted outer membrane repeat protein